MISPEDKRSDDGAKQARLAARAAKRREDEVLDVDSLTPQDNGLPPLTAEEHRRIKLLEALNVRAQLDKLLRDNNVRITDERRAELKKGNV